MLTQTSKIMTKAEAEAKAHDAKENAKIKYHGECIASGVIILIVTSYIPSDLAIHILTPVGSGLPLLIQEILDYFKRIS